MRNRKETGSHFEKLKMVLIVLSIFAAVKMLFFAFGLDEEYQLVMAYRNVKGDKLFLDMWEPHQSSAFLCALLMRPYLAVCGETGVVVWLRFCGTRFELGVILHAEMKSFSGDFHRFHQCAVGACATNAKPFFLEQIAVGVVELVSVAVPFHNALFAVCRR